MSPEQARGQSVDNRADIWAFGCVLFEMLTGRGVFGRDTHSDTIAAVLTATPDSDALPPQTPDAVRRLRRTLEKDPARRLRDIGEARVDIDEALRTTSDAATDRRHRRRRWPLWSAAAAAVT